MKKLVISAMALGLLLAAPAMAAPNDHQDRGGRDHATMQDRHAQGGARERHSQGAAYQARSAGRMQSATFARDRNAVRTTNRRANFTTQRANYATRRANLATQRAVYSTRRANYATGRANRAVVRMNYATYRANVQSQHRYHWNAYQRPNGWYSHRWGYGERLPVSFYASNYWIGDYISFGLMAPPSGLVWVRYGDDALLINRYNGEVVRVEYDVFY